MTDPETTDPGLADPVSFILKLCVLVVGFLFAVSLFAVYVNGELHWKSGLLSIPAIFGGSELTLLCFFYMSRTKTGLFSRRWK